MLQFRLTAVFVYFFICLQTPSVKAWDSDDLELFDIVEEVNQNFYDVLGVEQSATSSEIRRSYRKLSLQLHPDKNKEEDAEIKFRQLVAIYEVLKDDEKRQKYDAVLVNGLPDWRQPVYYYRRVRKMGMLELSLLLTFILTTGHFIVIWAAYLEKRFVMEEAVNTRFRKDKKGKKGKQQAAKADDILQKGLETVQQPRLLDLLPIKIVTSTVSMIIAIPQTIRSVRDAIKEQHEIRRKEQQEKEEEKQMEIEEREEAERQKERRQRRRIQKKEAFQKQETVEPTQSPVVYMQQDDELDQLDEYWELEEEKKSREGMEWTDEELALLAKAVAKFPGGTMQRWEKISDMVIRSVKEVTAMAKMTKSAYARSVDTAAQGLTGALTEKDAGVADHVMTTRDSDWLQTNGVADDTANVTTTTGKKKKKSKNKSANKQENSTQSQLLNMPNKDDIDSDSASNVCKMCGLAVSGGGVLCACFDVDASLKVDNSQIVSDSLVWTQNQQTILEWALAQYPKGTTERWEKIAEHIPGKTKADCVKRFKYLAEIVRKRKQQPQDDQSGGDKEIPA